MCMQTMHDNKCYRTKQLPSRIELSIPERIN